MSKYISFPIDEKLHKKMKTYLFNLQEEKTITKYITELIEKDLKDKKISINREEQEVEEG